MGRNTPASVNEIDGLVEWFRAGGVHRFLMQVAPDAEPTNLPEILLERGFRRHNEWVKLYRDTAHMPLAPTSLKVLRIGADLAQSFAELLARAFDWPQTTIAPVAALVGRRAWHHYMAFDGARPAATAAFFVDGQTAWLDFASTDPQFRGRGAQSALIAHRIADARELGARRLVVEAAAGSASHPPISRRNLERLGFKEAYRRPNYLLE